MTAAADVATRCAENEVLARELCELSALISVATAQLAMRAAAFQENDGWAGDGFMSCTHWLTVNAGLAPATGSELLRFGAALASLPKLSVALSAGEISFDKVRALSRVATADDEEFWLELARQATGAQLLRICRGFRRASRTDDADLAESHMAKRGAQWFWDDDGMVHLSAVLPPDDGAVVVAALESIRDLRGLPDHPREQAAVPDPAYSRHAAHRADALTEICRRVLADDLPVADGRPVADAHDADDPKPMPVPVRMPTTTTTTTTMPTTMVIHVDAGVLTGAHPGGRCDIENGPAISAVLARRIGCDTQVVAITERDGLPIDCGRKRRLVSTRLRRAVHARDGTCRFPGCAVPVARTDAHHVVHWLDDGPTDLANLVSQCRFHHGRLHDGAFRIVARGGGDFVFVRPDGEPIARPVPRFDDGLMSLRDRVPPGIDGTALFAQDAGSPLDLGYAVGVILDAVGGGQGSPAMRPNSTQHASY